MEYGLAEYQNDYFNKKEFPFVYTKTILSQCSVVDVLGFES